VKVIGASLGFRCWRARLRLILSLGSIYLYRHSILTDNAYFPQLQEGREWSLYKVTPALIPACIVRTRDGMLARIPCQQVIEIAISNKGYLLFWAVGAYVVDDGVEFCKDLGLA
jgi:hypothetical protein